MGRQSLNDPPNSGSKKAQSKSISEGDVCKRIDQHRLQSKKRAIDLLSKSLASQLIDDKESQALIAETCLHLGIPVPSSQVAPPTAKESTQVNQPPKKNPVGRPSTRASQPSDEHNEVCEVCERGGDLLCCETCTLVFHLKCLRPKLSALPKKKWSCPHCILDNLAPGDKEVAKEGIQQMNKLAHGIDPDDPDIDPTFRLGKAGETTIVYSGKKYIVRKRARRQIEELGRFSTLQEALITIPAVEEAKNGKKRLAKEQYDEDLWCTHCMDDPTVEICGFCGCKICFGRFDTHLMVLCDNCERETHTFCMNPPTMEVPEVDPWYCEACIESGEVVMPDDVEEQPVEENEEMEEAQESSRKKRKSKTSKTKEKNVTQDEETKSGKKPGRKRGPKKGDSKSKSTNTSEVKKESVPEKHVEDILLDPATKESTESDPLASLTAGEGNTTPIVMTIELPALVDSKVENNIESSFAHKVQQEFAAAASHTTADHVVREDAFGCNMEEDPLLSMHSILQSSEEHVHHTTALQQQQREQQDVAMDVPMDLVEEQQLTSAPGAVEPVEDVHTVKQSADQIAEESFEFETAVSNRADDAISKQEFPEDAETTQPMEVEVEESEIQPQVGVELLSFPQETDISIVSQQEIVNTSTIEQVITETEPLVAGTSDAPMLYPPVSPQQFLLSPPHQQHMTPLVIANNSVSTPAQPLSFQEPEPSNATTIVTAEVTAEEVDLPVTLTGNMESGQIIQHPFSPSSSSMGINSYFQHTFQGEDEKLEIDRAYADMFAPQHSQDYDLSLSPPISSPAGSLIMSPSRGRGRPPGTFKRKDLMSSNHAVPQNTYSIRPHREKSYQSLMSPQKKFKSDNGSIPMNPHNSSSSNAINKKIGQTSQNKKKKVSAPKRVEEAFDPRVYAVDNICKMVQEANERKITPNDLDALELLRIWAPKQDLERVVNDLTVVRDKLLRRLNRMAPDVAQDFLRKTNITDHIDFDLADDYDHDFELVDQDPDPNDHHGNEMDFEHDPIDHFIAYNLEHEDQHPQEHHQHHHQLSLHDDGSESPDLLLQFSMLEENDDHDKNHEMVYGHHEMMSMHAGGPGSVQPHDSQQQTMHQSMMNNSHQMYMGYPPC